MNPILTQLEQATMAKVNPPALQQAVNKIVKMGKHILYSPESRDVVSKNLKMIDQGHAPQLIGEGTAKVLGLVIHASKGTMPPKIGIPASTIIMCEILDLLEKAGKVQITPDFVAQCVKAVGSSILVLYGATPEMMQKFFSSPQAQAKLGGKPAQQPAQPPQQPAGGLIQSAQGVAA